MSTLQTEIKRLLAVVGVFFFMASLVSCQSVKAYQKMYLNDTDMELSQRPSESMESNFFSYREGASGANGGKTGGGCGCN